MLRRESKELKSFFVGADEYVMSALWHKMEDIRSLTQTMLLYPNAQARYSLHRLCCNAKITYWIRAQFPAHAAVFVVCRRLEAFNFKEQQMKLVASYHGIYDVNDFNRNQSQTV